MQQQQQLLLQSLAYQSRFAESPRMIIWTSIRCSDDASRRLLTRVHVRPNWRISRSVGYLHLLVCYRLSSLSKSSASPLSRPNMPMQKYLPHRLGWCRLLYRVRLVILSMQWPVGKWSTEMGRQRPVGKRFLFPPANHILSFLVLITYVFISYAVLRRGMFR